MKHEGLGTQVSREYCAGKFTIIRRSGDNVAC